VVALKHAVPLPLHAPCTPSGSKIKLGDGARGKGTNAGLRAAKSLTPRGPAGAMTGGSEGQRSALTCEAFIIAWSPSTVVSDAPTPCALLQEV